MQGVELAPGIYYSAPVRDNKLDPRSIRKSVKRFLKYEHEVSLANTPDKKYKEMVAEGVRVFIDSQKGKNGI